MKLPITPVRSRLLPPARRGARLTLVASACLLGLAAHAQQAAPAAGSTSPEEKPAKEAQGATQTITISATRRKELVSEVPLAITSISTEQLQETGARSMNDYLAAVPGVVLQNSGPIDGTGFIIIRGLTLGIDSNSPTSVYLDDVPLARGSSFDLNLLDLSRFEVLRGPQGTLYGSSAIGGIVRYNSLLPDTTALEGKATVGASRTHAGGTGTTLSGVLNVPLSNDVAALRVAAFRTDDPGWVDATGPAAGEDVNSADSHGARASLLVAPARGLQITANGMTQTRKTDGLRRVVYDIATGRPVAGDLVYTQLGGAEPTRSKRDLASVTVDYDLGWARFTSVTAHQKMNDQARTDFNALGMLFFGAQAWADSTIEQTKTTQEFRLVSQGSGPLQWLVGFFHDDLSLKSESVSTADFGGVPTVIQQDGGTRDYKENSVYGTLTWEPTRELAVTGGLRLARFKQTDDARSTLSPANLINFNESATTYLLAARYRLSAGSNVYARAANGYRPGGGNFSSLDPATGQPIPGAELSYGSDNAWTYELGYKAELATGLSVEATVFRTDWKDLQQFTAPAGLQGVGFTSNLGKARVDGVEAGMVYRVDRNLQLNASLSLLDPRLLTDSPGLEAQAGDRLPNSPKQAVGLSGRYTFALGGQPAFASLNLSHVGKRNTGFPGAQRAPNHVLPAYTTVDLAGGLRIGKVDLTAYLRNATDERGQLGAATGEVPLSGRMYVQLIEPRTVGLTASVSF